MCQVRVKKHGMAGLCRFLVIEGIWLRRFSGRRARLVEEFIILDSCGFGVLPEQFNYARGRQAVIEQVIKVHQTLAILRNPQEHQ